MGILMLSLSLVMSGTLGVLQERTFAVHGPHWREGLFYTVRVVHHSLLFLNMLAAPPVHTAIRFPSRHWHKYSGDAYPQPSNAPPSHRHQHPHAIRLRSRRQPAHVCA